MTDPAPDEGVAICDSCGRHLRSGDPIVHTSRPMKPTIYWHKDCFEKNVKPFEGRLRPVPKQQ